MKQTFFMGKRKQKELNKVLKQIKQESMKNILHFNFIERDQKANSIVLNGMLGKILK